MTKGFSQTQCISCGIEYVTIDHKIKKNVEFVANIYCKTSVFTFNYVILH